MDLTLDKTTHIGLGISTHADAFQGGREAAQMVKSQLPNGRLDLVLVLGPSSIHFKDFIEGVRLVTGEETLIGIPSSHVFSSEISAPGSCLVVGIQSMTMRFSIAGADVSLEEVLTGTTALVSQFRRARGNSVRNFHHRGLLLFQHAIEDTHHAIARNLSVDMGLDTWLTAPDTLSEYTDHLICRNRIIECGMVGVECLSMDPWGVGSVGTAAFPPQVDVYREAAKAATREALLHLGKNTAALGFIFLDLPEKIESSRQHAILEGAAAAVPNIPFIGIPTRRHFTRSPGGSVRTEQKSVVTLLVPA